MLLNGYFYWSGVVINALIVFWGIVGLVVVFRNWRIETEIRKKYAVKNLDESGENIEEKVGENTEENEAQNQLKKDGEWGNMKMVRGTDILDQK